MASEQAQNVSSPSWPEDYDNRMDCTWIIRAAEGRIQYTMLEMDIEGSNGCVYDSLKIYDGNTSDFYVTIIPTVDKY